MRLQISKSKNAASLYVIKSTWINGVHGTKVVEKLGTYADLQEKLEGGDPIAWAKSYIEELNRKEKEGKRTVTISYSPVAQIAKGEQRSYNGGYLFLQKLYSELELPKICKEIGKKYKFTYDLNAVLSRLIYGRVLFPCSKLATMEVSRGFIEPPKFELQHIYRALEIIAKESDFIQSALYKNSLEVSKRNTEVLYYDCTNYFFEIEQEDGIKQYGYSKEHRPNPIVQMGLFMDGDGIPLAFCLGRGNENEQQTLLPLEKQVLKDYDLSKIVVCTDAGLSSMANRKFNSVIARAFITTQSIKKLKSHLCQWALEPTGWRLAGSEKQYDLAALDEENDVLKTFYKERWINEDGLEQRLIVTYSMKYRNYQRTIRERQVERAQKTIDSRPAKLKKSSANDYKRFITELRCTEDGEVAEKSQYFLDADKITDECAYDGFYAVCTNLEDDAAQILKINHRRWEIEESFRIMKTEFKARPVFLQREDRIKAHFTTCFVALLIYRLLEKRLGNRYTTSEILSTLTAMNFYKIKGEGYVPTYQRTDLTDALHEAFGFRTDFQIIPNAEMKNVCKVSNGR